MRKIPRVKSYFRVRAPGLKPGGCGLNSHWVIISIFSYALTRRKLLRLISVLESQINILNQTLILFLVNSLERLQHRYIKMIINIIIYALIYILID